MIIHTKALNFKLTGAIEAFLESELISQLQPVANAVQSVTARIGDVNANRGGIDKICSLVLTLKNGRTVVAKAIVSDLHFAVQKAAKKLRRSALKLIKRPLRRERSDAQRPGAFGERLFDDRVFEERFGKEH